MPRTQDPAETKKQQVGQLNRFARYYNTERPHRGIGRRTPITAFAAGEEVGPIKGAKLSPMSRDITESRG